MASIVSAMNFNFLQQLKPQVPKTPAEKKPETGGTATGSTLDGVETTTEYTDPKRFIA